ncbi:hypothetical protein JHK85_011924 [Glycine max]|nr:hypothetical protein JHK85_011924 [Glycine max]
MSLLGGRGDRRWDDKNGEGGAVREIHGEERGGDDDGGELGELRHDLSYVEDSAGGPDVTLGIMPKLHKVTLLQMDSKLPIDILENVMQLAIEGCKAIANYIREILLENTKQLEYRRGV